MSTKLERSSLEQPLGARERAISEQQKPPQKPLPDGKAINQLVNSVKYVGIRIKAFLTNVFQEDGFDDLP